MAYPSVSAPYGMLPINLIGGQVYTHATRQIPITSGMPTAIFFGDVVKLAATGTLQKDVGTNAATPMGVMMGCSWTDPTYGKTFRQFYPGNVVAADIMAYVAMDPDMLFKVAVISAGTTISYANQAAVGMNAALVQNPGNVATGNSANGLSSAVAVTATLPLRIVDVVPETAIAGSPGSYTEVIVAWNAGMHQLRNATGI